MGKTCGLSSVLWVTLHLTSRLLWLAVGISQYSLFTVTVPSGFGTVVVLGLPPSPSASQEMVAAGLPSAASQVATTAATLPALTVTWSALLLGLAERGGDRGKCFESGNILPDLKGACVCVCMFMYVCTPLKGSKQNVTLETNHYILNYPRNKPLYLQE